MWDRALDAPTTTGAPWWKVGPLAWAQLGFQRSGADVEAAVAVGVIESLFGHDKLRCAWDDDDLRGWSGGRVTGRWRRRVRGRRGRRTTCLTGGWRGPKVLSADRRDACHQARGARFARDGAGSGARVTSDLA